MTDISKLNLAELKDPVEIFGIDGSHKFFKGIGSIFYSTWSTVSIKRQYPKIKKNNRKNQLIEKGISSYNLSNLDENHIRKLKGMELECGIHDIPQNEISLKLLAENDMLEKETKAIQKIHPSENKYIFIDGPLVDPPKNASDDYIKLRAKVIREHLRGGTKFFCIVKRIFDDFYIKTKSKTINLDTIKMLNNFFNDSELLETLYINLNWGKNVVSDFIKLNNINLDHQKYARKGLDIYSFYLKMESKGSVIRIDYPSLKDASEPKIEEILPIIISQMLPGYNLPEPIILAHFLCNKFATECFNLFNKMLNNWAKDFPKYLVAIRNINDLKTD